MSRPSTPSSCWFRASRGPSEDRGDVRRAGGGHIAGLYGDELYGLELDGEVSGEGAMRCRYAPVHDEVRGICDALGLDYDRIATDRAGMLWAGEGMPHRFDACCEISDIARRLRAQCRDVASRSESPGPRRRPHR